MESFRNFGDVGVRVNRKLSFKQPAITLALSVVTKIKPFGLVSELDSCSLFQQKFVKFVDDSLPQKFYGSLEIVR